MVIYFILYCFIYLKWNGKYHLKDIVLWFVGFSLDIV